MDTPRGTFHIGTAVVGIITAVILGKQLNIMQEQLDELQAEQRPWVYADAMPHSPIFRNEEGGFSISVEYVLHNIGHLPAMYVWPSAKIYMWGPSGGEPIGKLEKDICREREVAQPSDHLLGVTVFPGHPLHVPLTPSRNIDPKKWDEAVQRLHGRGAVPIIIGCADYQFPDNSMQHHATGFAFLVGWKAAAMDGYGPLPPDPTSVPADQLIFVSWIEGDAFPAN